jgi:hypothetical protein
MALVGYKPGTVAIDGYLPLEHAAFVLKKLFPFPLAMSRRNLPLQSALPIRDAKIHEDKRAQQYWQKEHVCANILAEPYFIP